MMPSLFDLPLERHDAVDQGLGPGRAAGDVDVDWNHTVDALQGAVAAERAAAGSAGAHGDDPLGIGHLVVKALDDRGHLVGDGS